MPSTPNPELALLEQNIRDINTERQRVQRDYAIRHELLHNCDDMIHSRDYNPARNSTDANDLSICCGYRKIAAANVKEPREEMEKLLEQRREIERQIIEIRDKEKAEICALKNAGKGSLGNGLSKAMRWVSRKADLRRGRNAEDNQVHQRSGEC